jgi:hypothetical protein
VPRAGINIGDGCWGGHIIEFCDVFDTVKETGDHGSFNSWGRDRYWNLRGVPAGEQPKLALLDVVQPNTLRNNRWRCDHGWDIDLDDGSSHYLIYNNLLLNGGLKFREGFQRTATNNIIVNNSLHLHVWFENSGDVFARNIVMTEYRPIYMTIPKWGAEIDYNLFTGSEADRLKYAAQGCDADSLSGDPLFVNAAAGDFRVQPESPALKLGFVNFPMDQFGVQSSRLKALARTPVIPAVTTIAGGHPAPAAQTVWHWHGATIRELIGEEYSIVGVRAGSQGILLVAVPANTAAFADGLRTGDFITRLNGREVKGVDDFLKAMTAGQKATLYFLRNQQPMVREVNF